MSGKKPSGSFAAIMGAARQIANKAGKDAFKAVENIATTVNRVTTEVVQDATTATEDLSKTVTKATTKAAAVMAEAVSTPKSAQEVELEEEIKNPRTNFTALKNAIKKEEIKKLSLEKRINYIDQIVAARDDIDFVQIRDLEKDITKPDEYAKITPERSLQRVSQKVSALRTHSLAMDYITIASERPVLSVLGLAAQGSLSLESRDIIANSLFVRSEEMKKAFSGLQIKQLNSLNNDFEENAPFIANAAREEIEAQQIKKQKELGTNAASAAAIEGSKRAENRAIKYRDIGEAVDYIKTKDDKDKISSAQIIATTRAKQNLPLSYPDLKKLADVASTKRLKIDAGSLIASTLKELSLSTSNEAQISSFIRGIKLEEINDNFHLVETIADNINATEEQKIELASFARLTFKDAQSLDIEANKENFINLANSTTLPMREFLASTHLSAETMINYALAPELTRYMASELSHRVLNNHKHDIDLTQRLQMEQINKGKKELSQEDVANISVLHQLQHNSLKNDPKGRLNTAIAELTKPDRVFTGKPDIARQYVLAVADKHKISVPKTFAERASGWFSNLLSTKEQRAHRAENILKTNGINLEASTNFILPIPVPNKANTSITSGISLEDFVNNPQIIHQRSEERKRTKEIEKALPHAIINVVKTECESREVYSKNSHNNALAAMSELRKLDPEMARLMEEVASISKADNDKENKSYINNVIQGIFQTSPQIILKLSEAASKINDEAERNIWLAIEHFADERAPADIKLRRVMQRAIDAESLARKEEAQPTDDLFKALDEAYDLSSSSPVRLAAIAAMKEVEKLDHDIASAMTSALAKEGDIKKLMAVAVNEVLDSRQAEAILEPVIDKITSLKKPSSFFGNIFSGNKEKVRTAVNAVRTKTRSTSEEDPMAPVASPRKLPSAVREKN